MNKKLVIKNVSHSFGITEVLEDINLELNSEQIIALVGPSGCGKTTLLHLCAELHELRDGEIQNSFKKPTMMFQQPRLLPWKYALDNIAIGLKAQKINKKQRNHKATKLGLRMGLASDDLNKYPHELSGGMQQRVALARALVLQPDLLLLDEPFSALDIGLKSELYKLLIQHLNNEKAAVLMITHDLMEAIRLSDTILLMQSEPGKIIKQFKIKKPLDLRDDKWVYLTTAKLMQTPEVIDSFKIY